MSLIRVSLPFCLLVVLQNAVTPSLGINSGGGRLGGDGPRLFRRSDAAAASTTSEREHHEVEVEAGGSLLDLDRDHASSGVVLDIQGNRTQVPLCTKTDNSGPSAAYPCQCGGTNCNDGEWCKADDKNPVCTAQCDVRDGKGVSDFYPCWCGSEMCQSECDDYEKCAPTCDPSKSTGKFCAKRTLAPTPVPTMSAEMLAATDTPPPTPRPTAAPTAAVTEESEIATEAPTPATPAPTTEAPTKSPTEAPTQAPTASPTTTTFTNTTTTVSQTSTTVSTVTTTIYSTTTYTTTTRLRSVAKDSGCWVQDSVKTECIPMDAPEGAPDLVTGLRVKDVQAFVDKVGQETVGGFIFSVGPGHIRFPELPQVPIVIYCQPSSTFRDSLAEVGPRRTAHYKAPCACSSMESFESGCGNWGLMTNTETVYVEGGQEGCYNHCRARSWCSNFVVKETFGSNVTQCDIAGPEQCTFDGNGDFSLHVLDHKCLKDYGPSDHGWYKASAFQAGMASSCPMIEQTEQLSCTDLPVEPGYKGAKSEEAADLLGAKACRESCKLGGSCNTVEYCRYGGTCMAEAPRGRCCRRSCSRDNKTQPVGDMMLVSERGGWDVFFRDEDARVGLPGRSAILNMAASVNDPVPDAAQIATSPVLSGFVQLDVSRPSSLTSNKKADNASIAAIAAAAGVAPEQLAVSIRCVSGCSPSPGEKKELEAEVNRNFAFSTSELQTAATRRAKAHPHRSSLMDNGVLRGVVEVSYKIKPSLGQSLGALEKKMKQLPPSVMDQRIGAVFKNASGMCGSRSEAAKTAAAEAAKKTYTKMKPKSLTAKQLQGVVVQAAATAAFEAGGSPTDVAVASGHAAVWFGRESGYTLEEIAGDTVNALKTHGGSRKDIVQAVGDIVADAGISKGNDPKQVGADAAKAAFDAGGTPDEVAAIAADDTDKAAVAKGMDPEQAGLLAEQAAEEVKKQSKQQAARLAGQHATYAAIAENLDVFQVSKAAMKAAKYMGAAVEDVAEIAASAATKAAMMNCWPSRSVLHAAIQAAKEAGGSHADVAKAAGAAAAQTAYAVGADDAEVARQAGEACKDAGGSPAQVTKASAEAAAYVAMMKGSKPVQVGWEAGAAADQAGGHRQEVATAAAIAAAKAAATPGYQDISDFYLADSFAVVVVNMSVNGINVSKALLNTTFYNKLAEGVKEALYLEADVPQTDVTLDMFNCSADVNTSDLCMTSYIVSRNSAEVRTHLIANSATMVKKAVRNAVDNTDDLESFMAPGHQNCALEVKKISIQPGDRVITFITFKFKLIYMELEELSPDQEMGVKLAIAFSLAKAAKIPSSYIQVDLSQYSPMLTGGPKNGTRAGGPPRTKVTVKVQNPPRVFSQDIIDIGLTRRAYQQAMKDIMALPKIDVSLTREVNFTNPKASISRESWVAEQFTSSAFAHLLLSANNSTANYSGNLTGMFIPEPLTGEFSYESATPEEARARYLFWGLACLLVGIPLGILFATLYSVRAMWWPENKGEGGGGGDAASSSGQ